MLGPNDSKNGTRSYTLGNFTTLLLISDEYKTLCFSFEAFGAVKLIQQIGSAALCVLYLIYAFSRVLNSRYSISSAVLKIVYKNYKDFLIASITDHLFLCLRKAMLATNF